MKTIISTFLLLLGLLIGRGVTLPSHFLTQQEHTEDQQVINNLLKEDQEILQEEEIESGENEISHKSASRKLPSYLQNLQDIEDEGAYQWEHEESDMTLARAWLPFEIKEENPFQHHYLKGGERRALTTSVIFEQTVASFSLGDFSRAEIILTKRDNVDLREQEKAGIVLLLKLKQQNESNKYLQELEQQSVPLTKEITSSEKYYALNITQFLLHHLITSSPLDHPHKIKIDLELQLLTYKGGDDNDEIKDIFLYEIFDLQVDRPFIFFTYHEPHLKTHFLKNDKRGSKTAKTRKTRSVLEDSNSLNGTFPTDIEVPSHLCHRVDWKVHVNNDLGWYDLVDPLRLELGFCAGSCPSPLQNDHFNYTLHTFFVDRHRLIKVFDVPKSFPKHSCCVPISYSPISVWLLEGDDSFVRKSFNDVVVDKCGCR